MLAARVAPFAGRSGGFQARRAQQAPRRPALCIASLANGVAIGNHSNGNGAAMGLVNLEEQAVRDARGLCLSPLGQEAVQREINRQKATANKSPQKPYTFEDWERHKSSDRYIRHMAGIILSPNKTVWVPVAFTIAFTCCIAAYSTYLAPLFALPALIKVSFPLLGVITSCLSFLLVFRTNNSYGRFDEARKLWGSLVNRGRDLTRQCSIYFPRTAEGRAAVKAVARWVNAHNQCLRAFCDPKRGDDVMPMMREWLHPREFEALEKAAHRPGFCMQMIGEIVHLNVSNTGEALRMDENVRMFEDVVGACERLFRTPIPVGYSRHTSRFLSVWAAFVPIVLWNEFHWAALLIAPLFTWLLYSVEEIGVQLEEPFSMLPLAQICETIRTNTQEIAQRFGEDCRPLAEDLYGKARKVVGGAQQQQMFAAAAAAGA